MNKEIVRGGIENKWHFSTSVHRINTWRYQADWKCLSPAINVKRSWGPVSQGNYFPLNPAPWLYLFAGNPGRPSLRSNPRESSGLIEFAFAPAINWDLIARRPLAPKLVVTNGLSVVREEGWTYLEVCALLPNLVKALPDACETRGRGGGVDEKKRVCRGYWQPSHSRELHVPRGVEDVDLKREAATEWGQTDSISENPLFRQAVSLCGS